MSKFTPGPWFNDSFGNIWRRNPAELYQNGGGVAGDKPLAIVYKGWHKENESGYPVEANAALMADAPAMLDLISRMLTNAEEYAFWDEQMLGCRSLKELEEAGQLDAEIIEARALIAKHRGGV